MNVETLTALAAWSGHIMVIVSMPFMGQRWSWADAPSTLRIHVVRLTQLAMLAIASTVWFYLVQAWRRRMGIATPSTFAEGWWWHVTAAMGVLTVLSAVMQTLRSQRLAQERELAVAQHDRERSRAQLALLRGRLNPDLLSGALNAVRVRVRSDPKAAERGLEWLALVLGYVLRLDRAQASGRAPDRLVPATAHREACVTFEDEWIAVQALASLAALAFNRAVTFSGQIDDDVWACAIPPFSVIPLVEHVYVWLRESAPTEDSSQSTRVLVTATADAEGSCIECSVHAWSHTPNSGRLPDGVSASLEAVRQRLEAFSPLAELRCEEPGIGERRLTIRFPMAYFDLDHAMPGSVRANHVGGEPCFAP